MSAYLLLACCAAAGIFDAQRESAWDALRDVFYTHRFSNGEMYWHPAAVIDGSIFIRTESHLCRIGK